MLIFETMEHPGGNFFPIGGYSAAQDRQRLVGKPDDLA